MKTIKNKLTLFVTSILIFFIIGSMILNNLLLEKYYVYKNKNKFLICSEKIKKMKGNINRELQELGGESGLEISILNDKFEIISSSKLKNKDIIGRKINKEQEKVLENLNKDYFYGTFQKKDSIEKEIVYIEKISTSNYLILKNPMKELAENAKIANLFFLIIGSVLFLISILLTTILSSHFVKPIKKLEKIVNNIEKLDFSEKFEANTRDEINFLGEKINLISQKLSNTIEELNNKNNLLQEEIEKQNLFFANISHEFKTPLGLIRGYSEALALGIGEKKDLTDTIISEIDRLNLLIRDITELIRFHCSDFILNKISFDFGKIILNRLENYRSLLIEKEIDLEVNIKEGYFVYMDKDRIIQLFDNIFINAIKYTDKNRKIKVDVENINNKIRLSVYNSSDYINEKTLNKLFDNFFRIEKDRARDTGGSGLGLAIVKAIANSHNGTCFIKNENNGILVKIELLG